MTHQTKYSNGADILARSASEGRSLPRLRFGLVWLALLAGMILGPRLAQAQPTYRLDVKAELKPAVQLRLNGMQLQRSAVTDDPGFRLQYLFRKDGQAVAALEARSRPSVDLPRLEPGVYNVAVELFYPTYKGGVGQKGQFKPISNVITYRIDPGTPPRPVVLPYPGLQAALGILFQPKP